MMKDKNGRRALVTSLKNLLERCEVHENLISQIHAHSTTIGLFTGISNRQDFACKLLNIYAKLNRPAVALKVFAQIPHPDIVSWTSLLNLYLKTQQSINALSGFSTILFSTALKPDARSVLAAVSACSRLKDLRTGRAVHGMVYRFLHENEMIVDNALIDLYSRVGRINLAKRVFDGMQSRDVSTWTSLLNGFVVCGDVAAARQTFDDIPHRNVVSWTAMIIGYVRFKNPVEALLLFRTMKSEGAEQPTSITIVAVLSGCADIGALDFGRCIHGFIHKVPGFSMDVAVSNGLIDMYAKSGHLECAQCIFNGIANKDLFSWTSIISGLAYHGRGKEALELFDGMVASGETPNDVTFLSILSACSHSGLVVEGQNLFTRSMGFPSFEPRMEHYGCMVDLLGRAGFLEEAMRLIGGMPMKPDAVIWRSFMSACLGHKNLELAEISGKKVLELEPDDDGTCILLWNLYRSKKMWKEAGELGKMMRDQRIRKQPGCSWLELNGVVHEFLAETSLEPMREATCILLDGIARQSEDYAQLGIPE